MDTQGQMSADSRHPHLYDYCAFSSERLTVLHKHHLINPLQPSERELGDGKYREATVARQAAAQKNPTLGRKAFKSGMPRLPGGKHSLQQDRNLEAQTKERRCNLT